MNANSLISFSTPTTSSVLLSRHILDFGISLFGLVKIPKSINSQRFWDHMDRIKGHMPLNIWRTIHTDVIRREAIDLSSVSYDGTNFYTLAIDRYS
jgi:hypothetical protein